MKFSSWNGWRRKICCTSLTFISHAFYYFTPIYGNVRVSDYLFYHKATAYFNSTADTKTILQVLFKEMSSSSSWQSEHAKYTNSGVDLQIFLENFVVKILNNANWMNEGLPLNFMSMIFKDILTEKGWVEWFFHLIIMYILVLFLSSSFAVMVIKW